MDRDIVLKTINGFLSENRILKSHVADTCGFSRCHFYSVLKGRFPLTKKMAERLSEMYGFSEEWLMSGCGSVFVSEGDNMKPDLQMLKKKILQQEFIISEQKTIIDNLKEELFSVCHKYGITAPCLQKNANNTQT